MTVGHWRGISRYGERDTRMTTFVLLFMRDACLYASDVEVTTAYVPQRFRTEEMKHLSNQHMSDFDQNRESHTTSIYISQERRERDHTLGR